MPGLLCEEQMEVGWREKRRAVKELCTGLGERAVACIQWGQR